MAKEKKASHSMAQSSADSDGGTARSMRDTLRNPPKNTILHIVTDERRNDAPIAAPESSDDAMAVVERRFGNLENIIADIARVVEQHEIVLREREDTLTSVAQSVVALCDRIDQWEKERAKEKAERAKETAELRAMLAATEMRLKDIEMQKSNVPAVISAPPAIAPVLVEPPPVWAGEIVPPMPADLPPMANAPAAVTKESPSQSYLLAARRAAMAGNPSAAGKSAATAQTARRFPRAQYVALGCAAPLVVVAAATFALNRHPAVAEAVPVTTAFQPARQAALPPPPPPQLVIAPFANPVPAELGLAPLGELQEKAKTGDAAAERDLGLKYLAGDNVAVNEEEAARWFLSASYRGEPIAEYWLGTLYSRGHGVPADPFQANHWYGAIPRRCNAHAMHRLGIANYEGLGVENNPEEAVRWFTQAAERGLMDAQFDLAVLYERGAGVMQNLPDAYKWYAIAAAQGDKEAASRVSALAKALKPAELAEATRAATEFKPQSSSDAAKSSGD